MEVEYELDQWEWQGTTRTINIDPSDYEGMSIDEVKQAVYEEIWRDAEQNLHFVYKVVYKESDIAQEILDALQSKSGDDNDDE